MHTPASLRTLTLPAERFRSPRVTIRVHKAHLCFLERLVPARHPALRDPRECQSLSPLASRRGQNLVGECALLQCASASLHALPRSLLVSFLTSLASALPSCLATALHLPRPRCPDQRHDLRSHLVSDLPADGAASVPPHFGGRAHNCALLVRRDLRIPASGAPPIPHSFETSRARLTPSPAGSLRDAADPASPERHARGPHRRDRARSLRADPPGAPSPPGCR